MRSSSRSASSFNTLAYPIPSSVLCLGVCRALILGAHLTLVVHTAQGARFNSALCDSTSLQGAEAAKALRTMWEREAQQQQAALRSSGSRLSPVRRRGSFHQQENKRDIVNDTLEGFVVRPSNPDMTKLLLVYQTRCGGLPRDDIEPTPDQIGALRQVIDSGAPPYVCFSIWGPNAGMFFKKSP